MSVWTLHCFVVLGHQKRSKKVVNVLKVGKKKLNCICKDLEVCPFKLERQVMYLKAAQLLFGTVSSVSES